ncbi:MAG: (Fe-S)-binding protein [Burkholderiales bacterium]|nr:(Fe-S)-binding protein [Burkholderiales bacterium]
MEPNTPAAIDPRLVTRILFQGFPEPAVLLFYVIGFAALGVFGWGCWIEIRKYRRGAPDGLALRHLAARLRVLVAVLATHRTLRRRDAAAGWAHLAIFVGFITLAIATATITLEYDITARLFGWHFWYGPFYLWFRLVCNIAGVGLVGGLIYMMIRRGWIKPPKLDYARPDRAPDAPDADRSAYRIEDWAFLWVLITIGVTGFMIAAMRLLWLQDRPEVWTFSWWTPVSALIAAALRPSVDAATAGMLRAGLWWFHGLLALAFIALIPRTKVKHIFTAGASLLLRDPLAAQRLPKADAQAKTVGYAKITDLTWKHLLSLDACTKCGRCHEACPARAAGAPLSPRDVILSLREFANDALEKQALPEAAELDIHGKDIGQVFMETLWSCRTCMACVEICPVAIEHVPIIVQMRRKLVEDGEMEPILQKTLQALHKNGNSFGESRRKRAAWTKALPFTIKDARKEPVDLLWFVGDYASFDPRNQKVTQAFARLLHARGVDFGILYEGEGNAGNDVRRVGEEGLYELLAENNIALLRNCGFRRIVTTDPHSLNTIRNEYPEYGARHEILHYTELLAEWLADGSLAPGRRLSRRVTYHDPCHLGRYNKVFEAPRAVMRAIGCDLVEMPRSRDNSFCCGAGGGRIWIPDPVGQDKPAHLRMREAAVLDGLETFVVACPKDLTMFEDALKATGNEGRFVVRELIELLDECLAEPAPAPAPEAVITP